jgi:hypothetical protein
VVFFLILLFIWSHLLKNFILQLFLSFCCLLSQFFLFLLLFLFSLLSLLPSGLGLLSQRIVDISWILSNCSSSRLLISKIVLCLVFVNLQTSLLVFLIDNLLIWVLLLLVCSRKPFFVQNILLEKEICLIQFIRIPDFLD